MHYKASPFKKGGLRGGVAYVNKNFTGINNNASYRKDRIRSGLDNTVEPSREWIMRPTIGPGTSNANNTDNAWNVNFNNGNVNNNNKTNNNYVRCVR